MTIFALAATLPTMNQPLFAYIVSFLHAIHPQADRIADADEIARAVAQVVVEDGANAPVFSSHLEDASTLAYLAFRESSLRLHVVGDHGLARGAWQVHGPSGDGNALEQARGALRHLKEDARLCPASPLASYAGGCDDARQLGDRRSRNVRRLMIMVLNEPAKLAYEKQ